jgi:hypothetical protein
MKDAVDGAAVAPGVFYTAGVNPSRAIPLVNRRCSMLG